MTHISNVLTWDSKLQITSYTRLKKKNKLLVIYQLTLSKKPFILFTFTFPTGFLNRVMKLKGLENTLNQAVNLQNSKMITVKLILNIL